MSRPVGSKNRKRHKRRANYEGNLSVSVRNVNAKIWHAFQARCILQDIPYGEQLTEVVREWLGMEMPVMTPRANATTPIAADGV